jgi:hypothetical protein
VKLGLYSARAMPGAGYPPRFSSAPPAGLFSVRHSHGGTGFGNQSINSITVTTQEARAITPEPIARKSAPNVIEASVKSVIPLGQTQYEAAKPITRRITATTRVAAWAEV